jgi:hypothetical protein
VYFWVLFLLATGSTLSSVFLHFVGNASFYGNNFTMGVVDVHPTTNSSGTAMSLELIVDCPLHNDSAVDYSCGISCNNF